MASLHQGVRCTSHTQYCTRKHRLPSSCHEGCCGRCWGSALWMREFVPLSGRRRGKGVCLGRDGIWVDEKASREKMGVGGSILGTAEPPRSIRDLVRSSRKAGEGEPGQ